MNANQKRRLDCLLAEAVQHESVLGHFSIEAYQKLYQALTEEEEIRDQDHLLEIERDLE